jgi:glucosamine 6-phosphate synthetase-like amidotransferase/phosphosugar isomerase protein
VVHNGIITNYKELRAVLEKKGYLFESETDTECIAKLAKYLFDSQKGNKSLTFTDLIKAVIKELEGAFAIIFKSKNFPNEIVAAVFIRESFVYCFMLLEVQTRVRRELSKRYINSMGNFRRE